MEEIEGYKRITKEIIRHLLELSYSTGEVDFKMMQSVFGPMAANAFSSRGIHCDLPEEKDFLLGFLNSHLKEIDDKNLTHFSLFEHFEGYSERFANIKRGNFDHSLFSIWFCRHKWKELWETQTLKKNEFALILENVILSKVERNELAALDFEFEIFGVETKYLDHWNWLRIYSNLFYSKFKSFTLLLVEVFFLPHFIN